MALTDQEALQVNQALFSLTHAYESRMVRENPPAKTGMTLHDCAVLMVIGQFYPIQSSDLAKHMDVSPSTISIYVRRLTQKMLIKMVRNPDDRRIWSLSLTKIGQIAYQQILSGTVLYTRDFLSELTESEQQALHGLLQKATHSLGFTWQ
ncbi:MAG: MarR family transcriptional regulator [Chloroflexi bacterium]|nr:MarR family transcriptional regulator [Chloroflexota bacterium]